MSTGHRDGKALRSALKDVARPLIRHGFPKVRFDFKVAFWFPVESQLCLSPLPQMPESQTWLQGSSCRPLATVLPPTISMTHTDCDNPELQVWFQGGSCRSLTTPLPTKTKGTQECLSCSPLRQAAPCLSPLLQMPESQTWLQGGSCRPLATVLPPTISMMHTDCDNSELQAWFQGGSCRSLTTPLPASLKGTQECLPCPPLCQAAPCTLQVEPNLHCDQNRLPGSSCPSLAESAYCLDKDDLSLFEVSLGRGGGCVNPLGENQATNGSTLPEDPRSPSSCARLQGGSCRALAEAGLAGHIITATSPVAGFLIDCQSQNYACPRLHPPRLSYILRLLQLRRKAEGTARQQQY